MFSRVLLITSPISHGRLRVPFNPPAGIGYIAEVLKENGVEYDILDLYFGRNLSNLPDKIEEFRPDLLGISMFTHQYKVGYALLKEIKTIFPKIKIVAGGPHVSTLREKVLEECKEIDLGVTMEGEQTMIELCRGKEYKEIKGLIFRDGGRIVYTGDRGFIEELDSLPFPKYEKFELSKYAEKYIPIVSTRGCPFRCIYCPVKVTIGKRFRARSAENVIKEIQFWYRRGRREFAFLDDNFTLIPERVYEICNLIKRYGLKDLRLSCPNGIRADKATREMLKAMKEAGFTHISFGVEVGNNRMLKIIKKDENIETIEKAIKNAIEVNLRITLFFIIGSPKEEWADIEDSLRLAQKYPVYSVKFYNLIPFPATELFSHLQERGYLIKPPAEYLNSVSSTMNEPVFATPELSVEQRKMAFRLGEKVGKVVLRRYFKNRLKYLGLIGEIFAVFIASSLFITLYWENYNFRRFIRKFRKYI